MKKALIILCLLLMGVLGLQKAVSFTNASIESKATLRVTESEKGLVAITAPKELKLTEGETVSEFLTIRSNVAGYLNYNLFYQDDLVVLEPVSGGFAEEQKIALTAKKNGTTELNIRLEAGWHAGKAVITTIIPVTVEKAPIAVPVKAETKEQEKLETEKKAEQLNEAPVDQEETVSESEALKNADKQLVEVENEGLAVEEAPAAENKFGQQLAESTAEENEAQ